MAKLEGSILATRTVQLELTLEVEVTRTGTPIHILAVSPDGRNKSAITGTYELTDYLFDNRRDTLRELFLQQEP